MRRVEESNVSAPLTREGQGGGVFGEVFLIGRLGKPHGVKGEIAFSFTTDVWDRVEADYLILDMDGILVPFFLEEYRFRSEHTALLHFVGLDSIEDIQRLCGAEAYFPYALIPEDNDSEYTWGYFKGFHIHDEQRGDLGEVVRVDDSTENVLFELSDGQLIPAAEAFIHEIDHQNRIIHMALPDGLLELGTMTEV